MKNNNGFTLVELLAVVVVLAIIVTIATTSTISISNKIKGNMYCSKLDFLLFFTNFYAIIFYKIRFY